MKKALTKLICISLGLTMAVGAGVAIANNKKVAPVDAAIATDTYTLADAISSGYGKHENENFIVTCGGGGSSVGVNDKETNWNKFNLSDYSKYAVSPVTTSDYALAVALKISTSDVTSMTFAYTAGTNSNKGHIYAIYSSNNTTFSQLTITSGTAQNSSLTTTSGTFTFNFAQCTGYFGILIVRDESLDINKNLKYTNATLSLTHQVAGYTLTYNANGGTGTMTDSNSPYEPSSTVTVLGNEFTRSGYSFDRWNTAPNGSGTFFDEGDTFSISDNTTLYAQWSVVKYPCTYEDGQIIWNLAIATYDTMTSTSATWVSSKATISVEKQTAGTATNAYCPPANSSTRFYTNSEMTISPVSGYRIDSVVFTATSNSYATALNDSTWTNASHSVSSSTVTVTPTTKTSNVVVTFTGVVGLNRIVVNYSPNLSSVALSGTYPTEFTEGDVFSHEGMVVTATYFDSTSANVTLSATWSGYNMSTTGSQTVTVSYTEEGITKSATYSISVAEAVGAYITPEKNSTNGFTGQNETLSFSFGYLASSVNVSSSNTSIVTVEDPSIDGSSGTVQINFVAVGSANILFKDGVTQLAIVSVSVAASHVTIADLPATSFTDVGQNVDLGSLITITAYGTCSNAVTWSSANPSIATVNSSGVVTGVAMGTTSITVSSNDYPSATMTCVVDILEKIDLSDRSYNVAKPASPQDSISNTLIGGYTMNLLNAHNNAGSNAYLMLATTQIGAEETLFSNKTPLPGPITKIIFNTTTGSSVSASFNAALSSSEVVSKVTDDTHSLTGKGSITITADANDNMRYFAISCVTSGYNGQLQSVEVLYDKPTANEAINNTATKPTLAYKYTNNGSLAFTGVAIRFSGLINKAVWDELNAASTIQGYGILFAMADLGSDTIEDYYDLAKDGHTIDEAIAELCDGGSPIARNFYHAVAEAMPDAANTSQKDGLLENYYVWNLFKNVPTASDSDFIVEYTAVAYIRTSTEIIFFDEATASVSSLAHDLMASGEYDDDYLEGSLKYLADLLP